MKKSLLIAAFGLVSVGANAQSFEEKTVLQETETEFYTIPTCYCKDGKPYFVVHSFDDIYDPDTDSWEDKDFGYAIYDENLSLIKEFSAKGFIAELAFLECGNPMDDENADFVFSQTLFNDDDAFEYMEEEIVDVNFDERVYDVLTNVKIMSEDGQELARITLDKPALNYYSRVVRLGETNYLLLTGNYFDTTMEYGSGEDYTLLYKINKASGSRASIQKVAMPKGMKSFPVRKHNGRTAKRGVQESRNLIVK